MSCLINGLNYDAARTLGAMRAEEAESPEPFVDAESRSDAADGEAIAHGLGMDQPLHYGRYFRDRRLALYSYLIQVLLLLLLPLPILSCQANDVSHKPDEIRNIPELACPGHFQACEKNGRKSHEQLTPAQGADQQQSAKIQSLRIPRTRKTSPDELTLPPPFVEGPVFARLSTVPAGSRQEPVLPRFYKWQKQFALPSACTMVLCHGSCKNFDDSCPSFSGYKVFDDKHLGMVILHNQCCR